MKITKITYTDFDPKKLTGTITADMKISTKSKMAEFKELDEIKEKTLKIIEKMLGDISQRYTYFAVKYSGGVSYGTYKFLNIPDTIHSGFTVENNRESDWAKE